MMKVSQLFVLGLVFSFPAFGQDGSTPQNVDQKVVSVLNRKACIMVFNKPNTKTDTPSFNKIMAPASARAIEDADKALLDMIILKGQTADNGTFNNAVNSGLESRLCTDYPTPSCKLLAVIKKTPAPYQNEILAQKEYLEKNSQLFAKYNTDQESTNKGLRSKLLHLLGNISDGADRSAGVYPKGQLPRYFEDSIQFGTPKKGKGNPDEATSLANSCLTRQAPTVGGDPSHSGNTQSPASNTQQ